MDDALALTPPDPVTPVPLATVNRRVELSDEESARLRAQVATYIESFMTLDAQSDAFRLQVEAVSKLGATEIATAASVSNRMLERPETARVALQKKTGVSKSLTDLRNVVDALDPARQSGMLSPRRLLGFIPFGSKIRSYFRRYESAQGQLDAIMQTLYRGKDDLLRDNAAIENEKTAMWTAMHTMRAAAYLCEELDAELETRLAALAAQEPDQAKRLREDVLLPVRQRNADLLTQLAVNVQGYQVLEILKRNNLELIKGVDRATTTTISALRTAVTASQALAGQSLVLQQITALNDTTGAMIESTSRLLGTQGAAIHQQAASATVDIERLKAAFTSIYGALDDVDAYKEKALASLSQSVAALHRETAKAEQRLRP